MAGQRCGWLGQESVGTACPEYGQPNLPPHHHPTPISPQSRLDAKPRHLTLGAGGSRSSSHGTAPGAHELPYPHRQGINTKSGSLDQWIPGKLQPPSSNHPAPRNRPRSPPARSPAPNQAPSTQHPPPTPQVPAGSPRSPHSPAPTPQAPCAQVQAPRHPAAGLRSPQRGRRPLPHVQAAPGRLPPPGAHRPGHMPTPQLPRGLGKSPLWTR